ncbi:hypothetical protein SARC_02824 [Sphaeroforma arctica JP610]|uniref:Uncharacterized protein n=1 Tax=Sphaeroforma arctica JP610 TaxID=667725 RepID=A0A0L0G7R8_9EUKA|nr:hypothetical protein SARC_02824 [Sphaeroforma arctica JP610]KNC84969.1 hypothetical protein SARC_02824 [Sphaeroforma arctica JP610]|eukprot:XP_014158871.1 hypothetical protein SARC_02824 [Sphaeroforma arctica JP610]
MLTTPGSYTIPIDWATDLSKGTKSVPFISPCFPDVATRSNAPTASISIPTSSSPSVASHPPASNIVSKAVLSSAVPSAQPVFPPGPPDSSDPSICALVPTLAPTCHLSDAPADNFIYGSDADDVHPAVAPSFKHKTTLSLLDAINSLDPKLPESVKQAQAQKEWPNWEAAIYKEHAVDDRNQLADLIPTADVPHDARIIHSKHVFNIEHD